MKSTLKRHHRMVSDPLRTPLLEKAISRIIKKGDVVFDLGCGLGVLSLAAIKAGAKKVYACDVDKEALALAYKTIREKGWERKIFLFEGLSSDIGLPEKVDVILAETVGSLGLDENIVPFVIDARDRFLKKGGMILPHSIQLFIAPIDLKRNPFSPRSAIRACPLQNTGGQAPAVWRDLRSPKITEVPFQTGIVSPKNLLAAGKKFAFIKFLTAKHIGFDYEITFRMEWDGIITGFAGWFECEWAPGLTTHTAPHHPQTHWRQALLPIREKIPVKKGQKVLFRLRIFPQEGSGSTQSAIEWGYRIL